MTEFIRLNFLIVILLVASGCGQVATNQNFTRDLGKDPRFTGMEINDAKGNKAAFTETEPGTTLQDTKQLLNQEWANSGIRENSLKLSQSINSIKIEIIQNKNKTETAKTNLKVGSSALSFSNNIVFRGGGHVLPSSKNEFASETMFYQLSGICTKSNCSEIQFYLSRFDKNKALIEKAGFVYRKSRARLTTQGAKNQKSFKNSGLQEIYNQSKLGRDVEVEDYVVASGTSTTKIHVPTDQKDLCLNISNLETGNSSHKVQLECSKKSDINVKLVGNSGVSEKQPSDQLLVAQDKSGEKVYIEIKRSDENTEAKKEAVLPITDKQLQRYLDQYFIKVNTNIPVVLETTKGFEKYRSWEELNEVIGGFKKTFGQHSLQTYFNNIKSAKSYLYPVFDETKVPATVLYITFWESPFFRATDKFNLKQIGPSDCELGPWQFTYDTARGFKNYLTNIFKPTRNGAKLDSCPNTKTVQINPNDDRLYLATATKAAAKYLSTLLSQFPDDPALGIMAYNMGPGNASKLTSSLDNGEDFSSIYIADDLGYDFKKLAKLRTAGVNYVSKFLAMYFIGADPEKHNIDVNQKGLEVSCKELYSPLKRDQHCKL